MSRFDHRVVLITGASSGIGAALAREFAGRGAAVALAARREDRLQDLKREIESLGGKAIAVACDVTVDGSLEKAVERTVAELGKLDVVVANAGFGVVGRVDQITLEDFRRQFETNVFGVLRTVYATLGELKKNRGKLVLLGSVAGHVALPESSPYSMSKFSVRALAEAMRDELRPQGVSVTLISPGFVQSEIRKVDNQGKLQSMEPEPLPKWLVMSSSRAARQIADATARGERERVITFHGKTAVFIQRHFPWVINLVKRVGLRNRQQPK